MQRKAKLCEYSRSNAQKANFFILASSASKNTMLLYKSNPHPVYVAPSQVFSSFRDGLFQRWSGSPGLVKCINRRKHSEQVLSLHSGWSDQICWKIKNWDHQTLQGPGQKNKNPTIHHHLGNNWFLNLEGGVSSKYPRLQMIGDQTP